MLQNKKVTGFLWKLKFTLSSKVHRAAGSHLMRVLSRFSDGVNCQQVLLAVFPQSFLTLVGPCIDVRPTSEEAEMQ